MNTTSSSTSPDRAVRRAGGPTLARVLASEVLKLVGLRSSVVLIATGAVFVVVLGPVQAIGQVLGGDQAAPLGTPGAALSVVLTGITSSALLFGILGVLTATSEFTHGSVRITFAAVPQRTHAVVGKAAALLAVLLPVVLASVLLAFETGRRILQESGVELAWADPDVIRMLLASVWYVAGWALLGHSLGWLVRSPVGGSFALLGVMFVLPTLTLLIPGSASEMVRQVLVSEAGAAMLATDHQGPGLSPALAAVVWTAYLAAAQAGAAALTSRRDA